MNFNNVLKSKYVYYAAVALMAINVLGYVSLGSIECVLVLGGAAYLANHFTKNRTADIFIGLFVSNILFGCGRLREGFQEGETAAKVANVSAEAATDWKEEKIKCETRTGMHWSTDKKCVAKKKLADVLSVATETSQEVT
jgi:hypothetical protein